MLDKPTIVFRDYQKEAIWSLFDYFAHNNGNPVVALPCGTGKSIIPAGFITQAMSVWPNQRFLMGTHVQEIIQQNVNKLLDIWPAAPVGIYSAGLRRRDSALPIIYGGIASIYDKPHLFGHRDIFFIDEAHLLSPDDTTMYRSFIADLRKINPHMKVVGLTATPFRLGQGYITDTITDKQGKTIEPIFTDICFDLTTMDAFARLIAEGYLLPVIAQRTRTELDVSSVGMNRGEFAAGALQNAVDQEDITVKILKEAVNTGYDRKSWMVPCSGVEHSEHVASMLNSFGISAAPVHSKLKDAGERDKRLAAFKRGEIRALVVYNVGIIGFDHPPVDYMPILRPTMSPALWVQLIGRGMRPSPGKTNLLVSDFACNTRRLGPINDPVIPRKKGEGTGDVPIRICESCGCYNHARARVCVSCRQEFTFQEKLISKPATDELLRSDLPIVEYFDVNRVVYTGHQKAGSKPTVKVTYFCGMSMFNEWVCFEHDGFAGKRARDWWKMRYNSEPPPTTADALRFVSYLRWPKRIRVWVNRLHPEILSCEF